MKIISFVHAQAFLSPFQSLRMRDNFRDFWKKWQELGPITHWSQPSRKHIVGNGLSCSGAELNELVIV